ncbi:hypothetical protein SE17_12355 [Kouleothrix aurantiaca]|jgi:hypothetical protein|uniref:Uncharacterized protein n=1 Tax=Kouleothrix aurantiaca TaxID=186479 RepID=A0A0N8PSK3_9CHLR|nr:hypothetical protein SE17_12355 [Kouleothrix aurantiaca]
MSTEQAELYRAKRSSHSSVVRADASLRVVLWAIWAAAVAGTAAWRWYSDTAAGQPLNTLGLVIYTILAGVVGLLVLTLVEQWFDPNRFVD